MLETAVVEAPSAEQLQDTNEAWIEALPARVYHTPMYGEVPVTPDKLQRFITNFKSNVRGHEIATDFDHGLDPAKGREASGWYRDFELRPSSDDPNQQSLYAKVEFTEDAKKAIKDGKYKYWSLEWDDDYLTDKGEFVPDVVIGGGLTNRPIAKRTMPINFSEHMWNELDNDTKKQFAVWSTAYVNSLPDSSFLYIDSNGRHLPYKDKNGKIDLPHLRNAAARVNQIKGISADTVNRIKSKIQKLLGGATKASEVAAARGIEMNFDDALAFSEAAMEHSDPGIAAPLYASAQDQPDPGVGQHVPRVVGDPAKDDPAIGGGWRREPLPVLEPGDDDEINRQQTRMDADRPDGGNNRTTFNEGGKTKVSGIQFSEDNVAELANLLGFDGDSEDEFMESARKQFGELKTFKENVGQSQQERQFSEMFPDVWAEHQKLLESNRHGAAVKFSESVSRINRVNGKNDDDTPKYEPTRNGLSGLALETIAEAHKKFSEGTGTLKDFEEAVSTIVNGGVIEFGEVGSSAQPDLPEADATTATGIAAARKLFAEKVGEIQQKGSKDGETMDYMAAVAKASEMYPDLAAAYRATAA